MAGRSGALLLSLPGVWTINRGFEVGLATIFLFYLFFLLLSSGAPGRTLRGLRVFVFLAPVLIFGNAVFGPAPKVLGFFSLTGARDGALIAYRLFWAGAVAFICVNTCPRDELVQGLSRVLGRRFSGVVASVFRLVPYFSDIRPADLRRLPDLIAERLALAEEEEARYRSAEAQKDAPAVAVRAPLLRVEDLLLVGPALGFGLVFALV